MRALVTPSRAPASGGNCNPDRTDGGGSDPTLVPKVHTDDLWSVDAETAAAIMRATHRVARLVQSVLALDGLNLLHATRAAAFQSVFHLHVHVVPRWDTDTLSEPPWPQPPGDAEQLADIASLTLRAGSGRTNPNGPARGAGD